MNILEIKALQPGSGKTTTLVDLFVRANLKNKILLTPSNKARQVCIRKLMQNYCVTYEKAAQQVKTLRSFKRNYEQVLLSENEDSETYVTVQSSDHITYEPFNIFIDEASMISDFEMQDLVKHWRIQNLVLDGDSLQFEPIATKQAIVNGSGEIERTLDGRVLFSEDSGRLYNLPIDHQVLLNKQMRASDPALKEVIALIKKGELLEAVAKCMHQQDCMCLSTDQHIAYTNRKCEKLNQMYDTVEKYIVVKGDKMHGFFTSEILKASDSRFEDLESSLMYEATQNPNEKIPTFEEWKTIHLKPAYAITCHKLQGSTIESGDIYIHLDDILLGLQEVLDEKERAKLFQKFLYIAVSRAISIDQINVYGLGMDMVSLCNFIRAQNVKDVAFQDACYECLQELMKMDELVEEMIDNTIKEDAIQFAADDENLEKYLESCLDYQVTEDEMYLKWKKEHYNEKFSEAQKGKHSKPHKPHKPHKQSWTQEELKDAKELSFKEWKERYNKSNTTFYKLRRM